PPYVTIPAGQEFVVLSLAALDDLLVEDNETVVVSIVDNPAYVVAVRVATGTIVDDDVPEVTINASDAIAAEPNASGTFTISRTGSLDQDLLVNYLVTGTAVGGVDYVSLFGSVSILSSNDSATVTLSPLDDAALEGVETVTVFLSDGPNYNVGNPSSATVFL